MLEMSWILIVEAIRTGSCHVVFRSVSLCNVELGECRGAISRAHESTSGELLVRQDHHHPTVGSYGASSVSPPLTRFLKSGLICPASSLETYTLPISTMFRHVAKRSASALRTQVRFYADPPAGAVGASGDAFSKREKANEDEAIRRHERERRELKAKQAQKAESDKASGKMRPPTLMQLNASRRGTPRLY